MHLTDETLGAYADGELDAATAREVEAALATNEKARDRLAAIRRISALSRAAFVEAAREPVPEALLEAAAPLRPSDRDRPRVPLLQGWRPLRLAFAGAFVLLIGVGIGLLSGRSGEMSGSVPEPTAWRSYVTGFHSAYVDTLASEGRTPVDVPASETQAIARWFTKLTGLDYRPRDLRHREFRFLGARLLVFDETQTAQLVYVNADGRILGFSAIRYAGEEPRLVFEEKAGANILFWSSGGFAYALVGDFDRETLAGVAEEMAVGRR